MDESRPSSDESRRRIGLLLGAAGATLVAVIAVLIVAEPFAKDSARGANSDLTPQGCVKDAASPAGCEQETDGLEGAKSVAVSPDGASVYVASAWDAALVLFDRNPSTGALTPQGCIGDTVVSGASCAQSTYGLAGAASVAVSADGKSVYVAGTVENTVVRFNRSTATGALTPAECFQDNDEFLVTCEHVADGLSQVEAVAVSPDGKSVYAGSNEDDAIVEFQRDTSTDVGALSTSPEACIDDNPPEGLDECSRSTAGLDGITSLTVSPDNKSVYATSQFDSAVVRFDRNTTTGALSPQGCIDDSDEGPDACANSTAGLREAWSVTVSPDGKSVYAVGRESDAIVRFDRDTGTGALAPRGCIESYGEKCAGTTSGLYGPQGVVVSPDGGQVYVASILGSVVGFNRDSAGALTSAGCVTDPDYLITGCETSADGLDGASSIAFSPGGNSLYVTSVFDEAIVHFGRIVAGSLAGRVFDSHADPVAGAPVEICRSGGSCVARFTDGSGDYRAGGLTDGSYTVTARPPAGLEAEVGHAGPASVVTGSTTTLNVMLGGPLSPPPSGTSITSYDSTPSGIPIVHWTDPLTLTTKACAGASSASYRVLVSGTEVRGGAMKEQPAGTYTAQVPPLSPNHGEAAVKIDVTCPSGPPVAIDFDIYIDPSGIVRNASTGAPIAGATVTLFRSDSASGPFDQVPDGSAIMSPGNRTNPDTTGADGSFGWDVVAGHYKVRATAQGCSPAETAVLAIPPPVTDLRLDLSCPVPAQPTPPGGAGAPPPRNAPVTPPANAFSFGKIKLNAKKGTATLAVAVPGPGSLSLSGKQVTAVRKAVTSAGTVSLPVKPNSATKKRLAKTGKATVTVRVTYTPAGGQASTKTTKIKLAKERAPG